MSVDDARPNLVKEAPLPSLLHAFPAPLRPGRVVPVVPRPIAMPLFLILPKAPSHTTHFSDIPFAVLISRSPRSVNLRLSIYL